MPIHNLNHVNMFLQVIASGSISSAARILRKSHTAVSSAVSNLEIDLCVELVRRDGYKVEPTEQALRLIPYMRSLLNYQQLIGDIAFISTRVRAISGCCWTPPSRRRSAIR